MLKIVSINFTQIQDDFERIIPEFQHAPCIVLLHNSGITLVIALCVNWDHEMTLSKRHPWCSVTTMTFSTNIPVDSFCAHLSKLFHLSPEVHTPPDDIVAQVYLFPCPSLPNDE